MKKHAFIFDMDGVIIDSNPFHKIALKQFCEKHGQLLTEDDLLKKIYGRTNKDWITNVFGILPAEQLAQYAEEKESLFRDLYEQDIAAVAGLHQFLELCDFYNIPRAIGTSAPMANVEFTLRKTKTEKFFKTILKDSDISNGKPDPEIYIKAAARLEHSPGNCIVFEDSLSGIAAGHAAGCKVVGVATTHTREELNHTDYIISDFTNLDPLILIESVFG